MTNFQVRDGGVVLLVRAAPGSRENRIRGWHGNALKISVTDVPEKGKANQALAELLVKALKLRRSQLTLLSGETSRDKQFLVGEISPEELESRIATAIAAA
jgi:uncharacterized protein (TIGR00251 family)